MQGHLWGFLVLLLLQGWRIKYSKEIKIIIGADNTKYKGWISTDINELDITKHKDFDFLFKNKKIDNILMEHVVEHLEYEAFISFLYTVKKIFKKGWSYQNSSSGF